MQIKDSFISSFWYECLYFPFPTLLYWLEQPVLSWIADECIYLCFVTNLKGMHSMFIIKYNDNSRTSCRVFKTQVDLDLPIFQFFGAFILKRWLKFVKYFFYINWYYHGIFPSFTCSHNELQQWFLNMEPALQNQGKLLDHGIKFLLPCCAELSCPIASYSLQSHGLQPTGFSVHVDSPARILEWVAMPSSRGSYQPRYQNQVSCIAGRFFTILVTKEIHE